MCLPIDPCFGFGAPRTDDDIGPPNKQHVRPPSRVQRYDDIGPPNKQHVRPPSRAQRYGASYHYNSNGGGHYYNGNSYYPAHGARAWYGHTATGVQEKAAAAYPYAGADGTLKLQPAAPNGKVAAADGHGARGVAQHNCYYYYDEPAHKQDAADCYYPAAHRYR